MYYICLIIIAPFPGDTENDEPTANWTVREYGDLQQFTTEEGTATYSAILLRSKTWPGHSTVANVIRGIEF